MEFQFKDATVLKEGRWNEKTCIRMTAGFDLSKANLPVGMELLPKGAPLAVVNKVAYLVKTATVHANANQSATSVQVKKGHAVVVGDVLNGSTVSAINTENEDFDVLTVSALAAAVKEGDVLADAKAGNVCGLNYATVRIDQFPTCTPTIQAYEIEEKTLPYPVSEAIKTALTSRHMFI